MREGAKISPRTESHLDRRTLDVVCRLDHGYYPSVHEQCQCNEETSLINRVLFKVPRIKCDLRPFFATARRIALSIPVPSEPYSFEEAVKTFPRAKRESYLRHSRAVELGDVNPSIQAFVKFERLIDTNKDPRMIQFRHKSYGLELATYLKPIEHAIYGLKSPSGGRAIAKGLNMNQRAAEIHAKMQLFARPVVYSIDASRWDAHVQQPHLKIEHAVYNTVWRCQRLRDLLSSQLVNRGTTSTGLKYTVPGGRMSGDMNTALGNCLLMCVFVFTLLEKFSYEIFDDGDDCLVFFDEKDEVVIRHALLGGLSGLGFNIKLENRATQLEQVLFCQARPVWNGERYTMVRDPRKIVGFGLAASKFRGNHKQLKAYAKSVGVCELALNRGIPVLQEYALKLIDLGEGKLNHAYIEDMGVSRILYHQLGIKSLDEISLDPTIVTDESRRSFDAAWGIDLSEQHEWETRVADLTLDC